MAGMAQNKFNSFIFIVVPYYTENNDKKIKVRNENKLLRVFLTYIGSKCISSKGRNLSPSF